MALINCPECSKQISSSTPQCPHCGYPINQKQSIKVQFPQTKTLIQGCYVYDENGHLLAECKQGGVATFETDKEEIVIKCEMSGYFGSATTKAKPGDRFVVTATLWGSIRISEF